MKKFLVVMMVAIALLASCDVFTPRSVSYRITGTAPSVDVTLETMSGGTEQHSAVALPVTYSMGTASSGTFLYVSAQNTGASGSVTVEILVNDSVRKTSTSDGAYVIASASDSL